MEPTEFDLSGCCDRRRRAGRRHRWLGGARSATPSSAWPRPASTRTGSRWSGRCSRSGTSTSREPYQARLRRSLGDAAADAAVAAAPNEAMATLGEILLTPTTDLRPGGAGGASGGPGGRPDLHGARPHHRRRAARQRPAGPARRAGGAARSRRVGGCRRSCACSGRSAGSTTRSCGRRSTAGSGWSSWCRPRPPRWSSMRPASTASRRWSSARSSTRAAVGGARYVEAPLEGIG